VTADAPGDRIEELARRIARLEDVEAIKRLQADYAAACDDHYNPDRLAALFTEDGVWDGGQFGRVSGSEALHSHFAKSSAQFTWALHFMIAPSIEVSSDGETARGSWYLWEPAKIAEDGGEQAYWAATVYDIHYAKTKQGWKFREMSLDVRLFAPYDKGW